MSATITPKWSQNVADGIGVNIHPGYTTGSNVYSRFSPQDLVHALLASGIRHWRAGFGAAPAPGSQADNFYKYAASLIGSGPLSPTMLWVIMVWGNSPANFNTQLSALEAYSYLNLLRAVESANEWNSASSGDASWATNLATWQNTLWGARTSLNNALILGPPLVSAYNSSYPTNVGSLAGLANYGSWHCYNINASTGGITAWDNQGSFNDASFIGSNSRSMFPSGQYVISEMGVPNFDYCETNSNSSGWMLTVSAAKYAVRAWLKNILNGIPLTYIYEAIDENPLANIQAGGQSRFGILYDTYLNPKLACSVFANITGLLRDQGSSGGPTLNPITLDVQCNGVEIPYIGAGSGATGPGGAGVNDICWDLYQRSDGHLIFVCWNGGGTGGNVTNNPTSWATPFPSGGWVVGATPPCGIDTPAIPQSLTVTFSETLGTASVYQPFDASQMIYRLNGGSAGTSSYTIPNIQDKVVILDIAPAGSGGGGGGYVSSIKAGDSSIIIGGTNENPTIEAQGLSAYSGSSPLESNDLTVRDDRAPLLWESCLPTQAYNDATYTPAAGGIYTRAIVGGGNETLTVGNGHGWGGVQTAGAGQPLNTTALSEMQTHCANMRAVVVGNAYPAPLELLYEPGFNNCTASIISAMASTYKDQNGNLWPGVGGQSIGNIFDASYRTAKTEYIALTAQWLASAAMTKYFDAKQMWWYLGGEAYSEQRYPGATDLGVANLTASGTVNIGTDTTILSSSVPPAAWGAGSNACGLVIVNGAHVAAYAGISGSTLQNIVWISNGSLSVGSPSIKYLSCWWFGPDIQNGTNLASNQISLQSIGLNGYIPGAGFAPGTPHGNATGWTGWSGARDLLFWQTWIGALANNTLVDCQTARTNGYTGRILVKYNGSAMNQFTPMIAANLQTYGGVGVGSNVQTNINLVDPTWAPIGSNAYYQFLQAGMEGVDHHGTMGTIGANASAAPWASIVQQALGVSVAKNYPVGAVVPDLSGGDVQDTGATEYQASWGVRIAKIHGVKEGCITEPTTGSAAAWWTNFVNGMCTITDGLAPITTTPAMPQWWDLNRLLKLQNQGCVDLTPQQVDLQNRGLLGYSFPPSGVGAQQTITAAILYLYAVFAEYSGVVNYIRMALNTAGATLTANEAGVALYDCGQMVANTATLLAWTNKDSAGTDLATTWATSGNNGSIIKAGNFTVVGSNTPVSNMAKAGNWYLVGFGVVAGTTMPSFMKSDASYTANDGLVIGTAINPPPTNMTAVNALTQSGGIISFPTTIALNSTAAGGVHGSGNNLYYGSLSVN